MSTLIENVSKVTAAHAALKTAIAAKGVAVPDGTKLTDMPALVEQISTEPVPTNPRAVFAYDSSTSIVVPKLVVVDVTDATDLSYSFSYCSLTSLTLPAGFGQNALYAQSCFNGCTSLTSLSLPAGFGQKALNLSGCFTKCTALKTITGNPNFKISFSLSDSTELTHDSIMVVINGLQTVTSTQTLTLGSTNLDKLTDAEKKIATDKGWTLA